MVDFSKQIYFPQLICIVQVVDIMLEEQIAVILFFWQIHIDHTLLLSYFVSRFQSVFSILGEIRKSGKERTHAAQLKFRARTKRRDSHEFLIEQLFVNFVPQ